MKPKSLWESAFLCTLIGPALTLVSHIYSPSILVHWHSVRWLAVLGAALALLTLFRLRPQRHTFAVALACFAGLCIGVILTNLSVSIFVFGHFP